MKLEEVQALSDEALRIKVAEFCGWVREDRPMIHPVQVTEEGWIHPTNGGWYGGYAERVLPNYPKDLNACHEIVASLDPIQMERWKMHLHYATTAYAVDAVAMLNATSRQRCEAFVLTMEEVK